MPTQRELEAMMNSFLRRQGWNSTLMESVDSSNKSTKYIQLQHNDYWLMGEVFILDEGYQIQFDIQEIDADGEVILNYMEIVELVPTINQLRVFLQKIIDDWRDIHKPIFNALLKLLGAREMASDGNPPKGLKIILDKVNSDLDVFDYLRYLGHE